MHGVDAATDSGCSKTRPSSPIIFVAFLLLIMSETGKFVCLMFAWSGAGWDGVDDILCVVIVALTVIRAYRHRASHFLTVCTSRM